MSRADFRCIAGCAGDYPLDEVIYQCPKCGDLLEVAHDLEALKTRSAARWIKLFDERYLRTQWPYGSGVWGKKEWVQPHVRDENVVSMFEGGTNLLWAERYGKSSGSRPVGQAVRQLAHRVVQGPGDDGAGVDGQADDRRRQADPRAWPAPRPATPRRRWPPTPRRPASARMVILPRGKVSTAQLVQPLANGATVLAVDGDFDDCMAMVQRLAAEEGVYLANSMNSLRLEGQKTVAIEIVQQFDWEVPDWVIIPGGNLGNVSALGAGFLMMQELGVIQKLPRICVAQAEAANPLYLAYKAGWDKFEPLTAEADAGLGDPDRQPGQRQQGDPHAAEVQRRGRAGVARPSWPTPPRAPTAPACSTARTPASRWPRWRSWWRAARSSASDRVVVVSTANGLKFTDFKVRYHEGELPEVPNPKHANQPVLLPNDYATVRDAVRRAIDA